MSSADSKWKPWLGIVVVILGTFGIYLGLWIILTLVDVIQARSPPM